MVYRVVVQTQIALHHDPIKTAPSGRGLFHAIGHGHIVETVAVEVVDVKPKSRHIPVSEIRVAMARL